MSEPRGDTPTEPRSDQSRVPSGGERGSDASSRSERGDLDGSGGAGRGVDNGQPTSAERGNAELYAERREAGEYGRADGKESADPSSRAERGNVELYVETSEMPDAEESPLGGGDAPSVSFAVDAETTKDAPEDAPENDSRSRVDVLGDGTTRTIIETGGGAEHGGTTTTIYDDGHGNTKEIKEGFGNGTTWTTIETNGGAEHGGTTTVTENDGHGNTRVYENDGHGTVKTTTTDASGTVTHTVEHKMPDGSTRFTTDVNRSDGTRTEVTGERSEQGREHSTTKEFTNDRLTSKTVTSEYRQGTDEVHKTVTTSPSGETITDTKTDHDNGSTSAEHVRTDPSGRITEHTTSETWQNDPQNPTRHYEATTTLNPDGSTTVTTKITEQDLVNNDTHQKTTVETKDAYGKQAGDSVTKETIRHWGQGGTSTEIVTSEHPDGSSDVEKSEFDEYHVLQSQTSESHPPPDAERPPDSNP
jgi:hypothetical protein